MTETSSPSQRKRSSKRIQDLSVIAPIVGLVLLAPPIIGLFAKEGTVLGAPVILVYLFSIWLGLIIIAAMIARSLKRSEPDHSSTR